MTSRAGFADEKDSVLGELAVRMRKLSTDGYKQRRGELFQTVLAQHVKIFFQTRQQCWADTSKCFFLQMCQHPSNIFSFKCIVFELVGSMFA